MEFGKPRRQANRAKYLGELGAAILILISPVRAWAWGCEGHQAVAMIAEKHMSARALKNVNELLQAAPIDSSVSPWCSSQGLDPMVGGSNWADDVRKQRPETSPWHYIDIPRDAPRKAVESACPASSGCVTSAIRRNIAVLRNQSAGPQERAEALRFVIHLVGDIHQPLHCVTNNDLGGNCVPIDYFGARPEETNRQTESYSPNLHSIWDSAIIDRLKGTETVAQWSARLDRKFSSQSKSWMDAGINLDDWAGESHELADSVVYARLPVAIPVERPVSMKACSEDRHASTRMLRLHELVSQKYVDAVALTINVQITRAGVRLAMILNQIWP